MTLDATVIAAIGTALAAILGGVGLVIGGMNSSHKRRSEELEATLAAEREAHAATRAALIVSRRETDVARDKQDEIREAKDGEIARLEGLRQADRLQHEADMQARTQELGGAR